MKLNLKIRIIGYICMQSMAMLGSAGQCEASSSSSAYCPQTMSASSIAAANASTHPLAKIFPINLTPVKELEGEIDKMSPDLKYLALSRMNEEGPQNIFDVSKHEMIPNLGVVGEFNDNFTVLITIEYAGGDEDDPTYRFNFYDFQEKIANLSTNPFFTVEGHAYFISPDGHYVAITRKLNDAYITSTYDIYSRQHVDPDNMLFNINSDGSVRFSSDSKMIVQNYEKVEIIDIQSAIVNPQAPSRAEFIRNINEQNVALSKNFRYAFIQKPGGEKTLIYDIQAKMSNANQAPLAEFSMPEATAILGSDSTFLALTTDYKTNIYAMKSLHAQAQGAPFYSIQNPPLYSISGGTPVLISPDNKYIITTTYANSINIFNTATGKLTKNVKTFSPLFSNNSKLLLAHFDLDTTVYELESNVRLIKVRGTAVGLNTDNGILITKDTTDEWAPKILLYNVSFLNNHAIKKILQGKLTLAQHAFIALLNKYYGSPISLAAIAQDENMGANAVNGVLRPALASFPEIIKGAIIKTYQIIDPEISKQAIEESKAQRRTLKAKFAQERELEAGREQLIHKALESKNKGKK